MPPCARAVAIVVDELADLLDTLRVVHALDLYPPNKLYGNQAAHHQQRQAGHEGAALEQAMHKAGQAMLTAPGRLAG